MDKEIPKRERRIRRLKKLALPVVGLLLIVVAIVWFTDSSVSSVKRSSLRFGEVTTGELVITISASGSIIPGMEEHVVSPITSRIMEVYKAVGDSVTEGEPLMLLDLESIQNQLKDSYDQLHIKRENMRQARIKADADLENREMQVQTKELNLKQLRLDLRNERFLDSIGSGTGENVRRAEMAVRTAEMELHQLRRDLKNQRDFYASDLELKQLELDGFLRTLSEKEKMANQARILSPRSAVLTSITSQIGRRVGEGEEVAVVADLSSYEVEGSISDTQVNKVKAGSEVVVATGTCRVNGVITEFNPVSRNSVLTFKVKPLEAADSSLRPGVRVDIYVKTDTKSNVMLLPNDSYFNAGPGSYELFVVNEAGTEAERRMVSLGASNWDYVEVLSGLAPGERVIVSNTSNYKKNSKLKIK